MLVGQHHVVNLASSAGWATKIVCHVIKASMWNEMKQTLTEAAVTHKPVFSSILPFSHSEIPLITFNLVFVKQKSRMIADDSYSVTA